MDKHEASVQFQLLLLEHGAQIDTERFEDGHEPTDSDSRRRRSRRR